MPITSNTGGVLHEFDVVTSNAGGVLHELDVVHSNVGGVLKEIHSGVPLITWVPDTTSGEATVTSTDRGHNCTIVHHFSRASYLDTFTFKLSRKMNVSFVLNNYEGSGALQRNIANYSLDGVMASASALHAQGCVLGTLDKGTHTIGIYLNSSLGNEETGIYSVSIHA